MSFEKGNLNRHILKALGIFGGVQSVSIIISFIRNKFAAVLLGTEGIGLLAIFNNAIDLLTSTTQLSIRQAAVPDVAKSETPERLNRIAYVIMRWAWILGLIGAFITIIASPWLSEYSFGNKDYTLHFCAISAIIFLASIQTGWQIIIQGVEDMSSLAKSQLWGAVTGAVVSIPMYFILGLASIIPSLLAYAVATALSTSYYRKRLPAPSPKPTQKETLNEGLGFIRLGFYMTASVFATLLASYLYIGWLNSAASIEEVGLFNAGNTIINRYTTLIFAAIGYEYYPRLSRIINSATEVKTNVSSEINMAMLVIMPMICIYLAFNDLIITILYSSDFTEISAYMKWAMPGVILKAVSWCMAFTILARGEGVHYIITETLSSIVYILTHIYFYKFYGIDGWGYAYAAWYAAYLLIIGYFYFVKYKYKVTSDSVKLMVLTASVTAVAVVSTYISQAATIIVAIIASAYSIVKLRKEIK